MPVLDRLSAEGGSPPICAHVMPHTFRRTYITFMLAAGFDLPYGQDRLAISTRRRRSRTVSTIFIPRGARQRA
jgi:integrase